MILELLLDLLENMGNKHSLYKTYPKSVPYNILWQIAEKDPSSKITIDLTDENGRSEEEYLTVSIKEGKLIIRFGFTNEYDDQDLDVPLCRTIFRSRDPLKLKLKFDDLAVDLQLQVKENKLVGWYKYGCNSKTPIICKYVTIDDDYKLITYKKDS